MSDIRKDSNAVQREAVEDNWEKKVKSAGEQAVSGVGELIAAGLLFVFGLYVFVTSVNMPSQTLSGGIWYVAPGVFPAFLGVLMCLLSLIQAVIAGRCLHRMKTAGEKERSGGWTVQRVTNLLTISVLLCAYVFLLGVIYYRILTFVFLAVAMLIYDPKHDWKHIAIDLAAALVTTLLVAYAFESLAKIPLP